MIDTLKLQVNENKYEAQKRAAADKAKFEKYKAKLIKHNQMFDKEELLEKQLHAIDERGNTDELDDDELEDETVSLE